MQQSRDILNDRAGVNTVDSALDARTVEDQAFVNTVDGALDARSVEDRV